jgi:hypothetical protein
VQGERPYSALKIFLAILSAVIVLLIIWAFVAAQR